jgi:hypothetical protein
MSIKSPSKITSNNIATKQSQKESKSKIDSKHFHVSESMPTNFQIPKEGNKKTEGKMGKIDRKKTKRLTDRQIDRQTDRKTDRQKNK